MVQPRSIERPASVTERAALWILGVFTVFAVAGFGVFGMHPALIASNPQGASVYNAAFVFFARGQVMLAAAALVFVLIRRTGMEWMPSFLALYLISLSSELAGTTVGF